MITLLHRAALCLLLLVTGAATVQAQTSGDTAPKDWYAVEVIVFKQWEAGGQDAELWPNNPALPSARHGLQPLSGPADQRTAFAPLSSGSFALAGVERRLSQSDAYRVLTHFGWIQPGLDDKQAPAVALPENWLSSALPPSSGDESASPSPFSRLPAGTELFGTLRVYRNRYLHVEADLRYAPDGFDPAAMGNASGPPPANATASGDETQTQGDDAADSGPPAEDTGYTGNTGVYVLKQDQRIHSGDIVYLDHPALGVLIEVRALPAADSAGQ